MNHYGRWVYVHHFADEYSAWTVKVGRWYIDLELGSWFISLGDSQ